MKRSLICSALALCCSGLVQAHSSMPHIYKDTQKQAIKLDHKQHFAPSIFLFLPVHEGSNSPSFLAPFQLMVTPTEDLTVIGIRFRGFNSFNGLCDEPDGVDPYDLIGPAVTLLANHNYVTTDASNWAVSMASEFEGGRTYWPGWADNTVQLLGPDLTPIGDPYCIPASSEDIDSCSDADNCGWLSTRSWTP